MFPTCKKTPETPRESTMLVFVFPDSVWKFRTRDPCRGAFMTLVGHFKHQIMGMISKIAFQVIEYKNWDLKMLVSSFSLTIISYITYIIHTIFLTCVVVHVLIKMMKSRRPQKRSSP